MSNNPESLWKVRDVAQFLSVSVSWIYKEVEAGRLPCIRLGASLRFQPEAIRKWLELKNAKVRTGTIMRLTT
jgi:excisionase family DNA binding protein